KDKWPAFERALFLSAKTQIASLEGMDANVLEDVAEVTQLLAARRRGLRHEIKNPAILHSVVGETGDAALLVEIDCDDALIDDFVRHEGRRTLRLLRDVIKCFAVDGGNRGRRAEHNQHLLLRGSDGNLFQGAFRHYVPALEGFSRAAAGSECQCTGKSQ